MTPDQHARLSTIFQQAIEVDVHERTALLERECPDDLELRRELESLLLHHDRDDSLDLLADRREGVPELTAGEVYAERYRVAEPLGRGGTSSVYRAQDLRLGTPVAIKLLRHQDPLHAERLRREVRLARQVTHPAVCRIFDLEEWEGVPFVTMESVDGEDLSALVRQVGRLAPEKVLEIARELLAGVAAAHEVGVLHRDLKPGNIMIDEQGRVRILDFGIAIAPDEAAETLPVGTPRYMAPEQTAPGQTLSAQTDLYAIGLVLYELLTGQLPPRQGAPERPSRLVESVNPVLEELILRALEQDPADRPASARAMLATLTPSEDEAGQAKRARSARTPERRQLTAMYLARTDSTLLADRLDLEQQREVIGAYRAITAAATARYEGHLAQILGPGQLVFFGYPTAREDAAECAVRAGREILRGVAELRSRLEHEHRIGIGLEVRVGIDTGTVVAGASHDELAIGEPLDVAAGLAERAPADSLLISESTRQIVSGVFRLSPAGRHALGGIAEPVAAYAVTGLETGLEPSGMERTPFVGREHELGLLHELWDGVKRGIGHRVLVSGEPGVGKSRLVHEFRETLADDAPLWVQFRCTPFTRNTPLYPVGEILHDVAGLRYDDEPGEKLIRLERFLDGIGVDKSEVLPHFRRLLWLDRPQSSLIAWPRTQLPDVIRAIAKVIETASRDRASVVVFEDLQWVDPTTLVLLGRLSEGTSGRRILGLHTARLEFQPPWPARLYRSLSLSRLSRNKTRNLIEAVCDGQGVEESVVHAIVERSDGNPLFAEELAGNAIESGGDVDGPIIPSTIQDLLTARLDRLGTAKSLAQTASVLGREFSHAMLAAILPEDERQWAQELSQLVDSGLLCRRGVAPRSSYFFKHALVRDAAYESLLSGQRRQLHGRIARALRDGFAQIAGGSPEVVASHFEAAGDADHAKRFWNLAGRRAFEAGASTEALHHLDRALLLLRETADDHERAKEELELLLLRGRCLITTRGNADPEVASNYERARQLCEAEGDSQRGYWILRGIWSRHYALAEALPAAELVQRLEKLSERLGDEKCVLHAWSARGQLETCRAAFADAKQAFGQALSLYDPQRDGHNTQLFGTDVASTAHAYLAFCEWATGFPDRALACTDRALVAASEIGDPYNSCATQIFVGALWSWCGDAAGALELAERCRERAAQNGVRLYQAAGACAMGHALVELGRPKEGIDLLEEGLSALQRMGVRLFNQTYWAALAQARASAGQLTAAREAVAEGLRLAQEPLGHFSLSALHRVSGRVELLAGEASAAEAAFLRAVEDATGHGARLPELEASLALAELWRDQGRADDARRVVSSCYAQFSEGFGTRSLQETARFLEELG